MTPASTAEGPAQAMKVKVVRGRQIVGRPQGKLWDLLGCHTGMQAKRTSCVPEVPGLGNWTKELPTIETGKTEAGTGLGAQVMSSILDICQITSSDVK